jgi:hypothetical protein
VLVEARHQREVRPAGAREAVAAAGDGHAAVVPVRLEHPALAERGHDRDQFGVRRRAVQALVVVLDQDPPVGLHVVRGHMADAQLVEVEAGERERPVVLAAQPLLERHRIGIEVHEHEPLPGLDRHRPQAQRVAVDLVLGNIRGADQAAVERVRPGVVRALDRAPGCESPSSRPA